MPAQNSYFMPARNSYLMPANDGVRTVLVEEFKPKSIYVGASGLFRSSRPAARELASGSTVFGPLESGRFFFYGNLVAPRRRGLRLARLVRTRLSVPSVRSNGASAFTRLSVLGARPGKQAAGSVSK